MSQDWNIPCCRACLQNSSIPKSSPMASKSITHCRCSCLLDFFPHVIYHLPITYDLPTIYQPRFLPTSSLKHLAKRCKYLQSITTGISNLGFQCFTSTKFIHHQQPNYCRSKWQKTFRIRQLTHIYLFVYLLVSSSEPTTSRQLGPVISE